MSETAVVLAHQGGWDEIAMVAAPLALLAGVLWLADRRARRMEAPDNATPEGS
jgi:predicted MFS family arabinose efflux permease